MASTLGAYITVKGGDAAIAFYKEAFGAEEISRMPADNDPSKVMHAELKLFGGVLMLSDEFPEFGGPVKSPAALGGTSFNMIIGFDKAAEVDAAIARAEKAGASVSMPAADMFWGDRFGMVVDPFGHAWGFGAPASAT